MNFSTVSVSGSVLKAAETSYDLRYIFGGFCIIVMSGRAWFLLCRTEAVDACWVSGAHHQMPFGARGVPSRINGLRCDSCELRQSASPGGRYLFATAPARLS